MESAVAAGEEEVLGEGMAAQRAGHAEQRVTQDQEIAGRAKREGEKLGTPYDAALHARFSARLGCWMLPGKDDGLRGSLGAPNGI